MLLALRFNAAQRLSSTRRYTRDAPITAAYGAPGVVAPYLASYSLTKVEAD